MKYIFLLLILLNFESYSQDTKKEFEGYIEFEHKVIPHVENYNVNYDYHNFGEDLGWSKNMARAKAKIFFDGRVKNKHCMNPEWLERVDKRVGF